MFAEIRLLVLEGDAAGLAAKVSELSRELREPAEAEQAAAEKRQAPASSPPPAAGAQAAPPARQRRDAPEPLVHSPNS